MSANAMKSARIGSISSDTLRTDDLISNFHYALTQLDRERADTIYAEYEDDIFETEDTDSHEYEELAQYCLEDLMQALEEHAPPYCYFGTAEGDGADFGFWVGWDSIRDDIHDGVIYSVGPKQSLPVLAELSDEVEYVLEENDHHNYTLYTRDGKEVWSIV